MDKKYLQITFLSNHTGVIPLGQVCEFSLGKANLEIETRAFITHQNIRYLKPITDWNINDDLLFFPEAPGNYTLSIHWRLDGRLSGWEQYRFRVSIDGETSNTPIKVELRNGLSLWGPGTWEASSLHEYEKYVFDILSRIVKPGHVIYDMGGSLGQYSLWFSRAVGKTGYVYIFEANPLCVYWLQANLELNRATNCEILPVAIGDHAGSIPFTINYGNSALGLTEDSPFYQSKIGHEIHITCLSLDQLSETFLFRKPDLIKIDVEGAEGTLISGMEKTLIKYRPVLLLEIHGQASAKVTFGKLANLEYSFTDLVSSRRFEDLDELLTRFPDVVRQFLCTPRH